jgi:N6-adenosine-specific RNA methylase IME4
MLKRTARQIKVQTSFAAENIKHTTVELIHPFATAIIDPDWPYTVAPGLADPREIEDAENKGRLSGFTRSRDTTQNKYLSKTPLSIEELKALPIGEVVGGYIALWTVGPFLINGSATDVLESWGFEPVTLLTWAKYDLANQHGYGGVGFWFLGNAEFCIIAKRPGWPSIRTGLSSLFIEPKRKHSEKPNNIHEICEQRFPGPYLEVFGRMIRGNWTVIGDEVLGDGQDVRKTLKEMAS